MTLLQAADNSRRLTQLRRDLREVSRELRECRDATPHYRQLEAQAANLRRQIDELEQELQQQP